MPTLSLVLLRSLLRRTQQLVIDADIAALLERLPDRDLAMTQADAVEGVMLRRIGSPAVVIMVGDQPTTVGSQSRIDDLAARGLIGPAEAERLGRRLSRRWQQWWEQASIIGLRGLRRRERLYAHQAKRLASRVLLQRAETLDQIKIKLVLLCAAPAIERKHLLVILDDLATLH